MADKDDGADRGGGAARADEQKVFLKPLGGGGQNDGRTIAGRQDALREALSAVNTALDTEGGEAGALDESDSAGGPAASPQAAATPGPAAIAGAAVAAANVPASAPSKPAPAASATPAPAPSAASTMLSQDQDTRGGQAAMTGPKTQIVRGARRPTRTDFHQEPVVAWLVVIGGPGLGAFRPLFTGNNTIGRATTNRVPIDFGDDSISSVEQAYIRYDAADREFLFVPNLSKTNVVSVNDQKPTTAVRLHPMDVITMGQTQLVFVSFCGEDFDWSELADL